MDLGNFGAQDVQQYLQGADFPLNKEDVVKVAENNGAPQQLQQQLPEGEISGPGDVTSALGL